MRDKRRVDVLTPPVKTDTRHVTKKLAQDALQMTDLSALFQPITLRGLTIPNRIAMAPMTRSFSPGGVPGQNVADYYARRAAADVGLIITEGTVTDRQGASNDANVPRFHGQDALAGWAKVVEDGMMRKPGTGHYPEAPTDSPSGVTHSGKQVMDAPTEEVVWDMVRAYARAAGDAAKLGFDAVEIHGAHGYLIDEFFWDVMNTRSDRYGGSLPQRATFAAEIIAECRKEVGPDMPLILRFSQWKQQDYTARLAQTPAELEAFLAPIVAAGVDMLHCSQRRVWEPEFPEVDGQEGLNCAGWTKKLTGVPTMTVGSIGLSSDFAGSFRGEGSAHAPIDNVVERLEKGEYDMIAIGRALIQDPQWATKVKEGRTGDMMDYDGKALATLY
jgi:2,4-dienoyl-CoA reductase-like NADH-dependent reductase (Old Yellow Enzyme family)